jgi:phospholipid/cholesterol/gamma-HCH transport system permease protein
VSGDGGSTGRDTGASTMERPNTWGDRGTEVVHRLPHPVRGFFSGLGAVGQLLVQVIASAARNPREYAAETRDEMYGMLRFCWLPVTMCVGGFCFLIGNYAYNILTLAGAQNRLGTFFVFATAREISPFCTGMAIAGVMGTALTADLGAREVREELDALRVLGVDVVRSLVLPRVLSITVMTVAFNILGVALGVVMAAIAGTMIGDTSAGAFFSIFLSNMTVPEMVGTTVKTLAIGLFIGIVCASKGLTVKGGAEGVGRAVNEAVVLCFAAVWILNFAANAIMLGLNPEMIINR